MILGEWLQTGRFSYPDKTALIFNQQNWTYAELDEIANRLAASLIQLGIQPGDAIGLHLSNCPEMVFCYYACFKIGAIAVPLNNRLKGSELQYILNHCGARLYIGQPDLFSEVERMTALLPSIQHYYLLAEAQLFPNTQPFAKLLAQSETKVKFPTIANDAIAAILYTSGTTARPKGVTHTHHTLERTAEYCIETVKLNHEDILCGMLPLCHIFGFALQLVSGVKMGATLLIIPQFEPELVLRSLRQHRATILFGLPVMYNALTHYPEACTYKLSSLRTCIAGGDAVPSSLQQRFQDIFGVEISEGCGMTEVIPYSLNPPSGEKRVGSIGKAAVGMSLRLVDEQGKDVPQGEVGEVLVKSEAMTIGYWHHPEATAATIKDGWLYTGDLAWMDADGYYWFVSRKKEIIVRGGSNISPLEVEAVLYQHPAVKEAAVIGVPDRVWGERVQAYVAFRDGQSTTELELKEFVSEKIAAYKVPEAIAFLPELPKGLTGKIQRKALKDGAIQTPILIQKSN
jgi:long-chain acyl-CoA synthetase